MELVALLRVLWRRRLRVVAGLAAALCLGFLASRGSGSPAFGTASTRVVLDTVDSQLVDATPVGADTLSWRAALLADLMGGDTGRPRIAKAMGVPENEIAVVAPHLGEPAKSTPLSRRAVEAAALRPEKYVVAIQPPGLVPIISIDATGPNRTEAAKLAEAAATAIKEAAAAHVDTPDLLAFVVDDVGPVHSRTISGGSGLGMAAAIALVLFSLWCAGVVVHSAMADRRRAADRARFSPRSLQHG